ncbi:serine hydrolase domain-containing protein [Gryllotalpicola ginsengisoli]|uniref:serine hydrolase domain-containing protein n=1 Tax=Gryllotalpicola ginsengisoli TaxID=444608 RepID=UPI0003B3397A|nr:serine hydrolase [Gryllotalpicola ginsengisoli]
MAMQRSSAPSVGIDPAAVTAFADAVDAAGLGVHGLVIARFGRVAAEAWWHPYAPDEPHMMFSVSKAFTSMAVGLAIAEGALGLDEPTHAVFPEHPEVPGQTIRHLLTMTTGHDRDSFALMRPMPDRDWVRVFFELAAPYPPGEHFVYDTGASYVLGAAVSRRTGLSLTDFLQPRLFEPLGWPRPHWERDPRGQEHAGTGLKLTTRQLAEFGQLLLQRGRWEGRQLVPADYVEAASAHQTRNPWFASHESRIGYGFQLWRSTHGFRADGMWGQFAAVIPELQLVVATTSGSFDANRILETAWRHLLPGVDPAFAPPTGHPDGAVFTPGGRRVPDPVFDEADASREAALSGIRFRLQGNRLGVDELTVEFAPDQVALVLSGSGIVAERLVAGRGGWVPGRTALWPEEQLPEVPYAAWAGWTGGALEVHQQLTGTPLRRIWRLEPDSAEGARLIVTFLPDAGPEAAEDLLLTARQ